MVLLNVQLQVFVIVALILYERKCQTTKPNGSDPSSTSDPSPTSDLEVNETDRTLLISQAENDRDGATGLDSTTNDPGTLLQV